MRRIAVGIVVCVVLLGGWIAAASWRWTHADMAAIFHDRIQSEVRSGTELSIRPGSVITGDLSDTGRLVCGDVTIRNPGAEEAVLTYSIVVSKTLFGHAINDGFTPATRPENQAMSDQSCASLRAHNDSGNGASNNQPHQ